MLNRSSLCFRSGLLLILVGAAFSLPNVLAYTDLAPELGEAWRSPTGVVLGAAAVAGGTAMVVLAFRLRREERERARKERSGRAARR